jgi:hypothetical protein
MNITIDQLLKYTQKAISMHLPLGFAYRFMNSGQLSGTMMKEIHSASECALET